MITKNIKKVEECLIFSNKNDSNIENEVIAVCILIPKSNLKAEDIRLKCKKIFHKYYVHSKVIIISEIPRNKSGKINRNEIRKLIMK